MKKTRLLGFVLVLVVLTMGLCSCMKEKNQTKTSDWSSATAGYGCTKYTGEVDKSHGFWEDNSRGEPWIDNTNCRYLEEGFESFYNTTGVWPYLYVTDQYGSSGNFATYEEAVYDQLFGDCPGNLLFVFIGNEESYYIAAGTGNGDIVNSKTVEVFENKINKYWSKENNLAKIFGSAMKDAGKQLMKGQEIQLGTHAWGVFRAVTILLLVVSSLVLAAILVFTCISLFGKKEATADSYMGYDYNGVHQNLFCYRCGTQIITAGRFCPNCGEKLKGSNPAGRRRSILSIVVGIVAWSMIWLGCILPFFGISSINYYSILKLTEEIDAAGLIAVIILFPLGGMLYLYRTNLIKAILQVVYSLLPGLFLWIGYWGTIALGDRLELMKYGSIRIGAVILIILLIALPAISIVELVRQIRITKRRKEMRNIPMSAGYMR